MRPSQRYPRASIASRIRSGLKVLYGCMDIYSKVLREISTVYAYLMTRLCDALGFIVGRPTQPRAGFASQSLKLGLE